VPPVDTPGYDRALDAQAPESRLLRGKSRLLARFRGIAGREEVTKRNPRGQRRA